MESRSLWTATDNAAAFSFSPLPHFGLVGVKGSRQEGEFRPAREASGSTSITAMAAGDATVGKLFLLGDFAFRNIFDNGCNYNTNQYEPTDDMPYYILDTNPSRWIRQEYDMRVRASLPLSSVLAAGLDVHYIDKVGAKQKDPRSETYVMDIDIRPSLAWKPAQAHLFGVSFLFPGRNFWIPAIPPAILLVSMIVRAIAVRRRLPRRVDRFFTDFCGGKARPLS